MQTLNLLAGIAYDPTIRGILAVLVGVVVLMGSVYLLLATNTGTRLGFLIAATGLFGWFTIMGVIWWIYGIGMLGASPSWEVLEFNRGDTSGAITEVVQDLDLSGLPTTEDGEVDYALLSALRGDDPLVLYDLAESRDQTVDELVAPLIAADTGLPTGLDTTDEDDAEQITEAIGQLPAEALEAVADELGGDWEFLESSNPKRGEAEAAVAAQLPECDTCDFGIEAADDYVVLDAFRVGGKPPRPEDANLWERAANKITNTLRITHPPSYAVVQVQKALEQETVPGQAPPTPVPDPDEPVISVVMVRDIGDRRFPSAMITIGSGMIFALLAWMLHRRESLLEANLAQAEEVMKG